MSCNSIGDTLASLNSKMKKAFVGILTTSQKPRNDPSSDVVRMVGPRPLKGLAESEKDALMVASVRAEIASKRAAVAASIIGALSLLAIGLGAYAISIEIDSRRIERSFQYRNMIFTQPFIDSFKTINETYKEWHARGTAKGDFSQFVINYSPEAQEALSFILSYFDALGECASSKICDKGTIEANFTPADQTFISNACGYIASVRKSGDPDFMRETEQLIGTICQ